MISACVLLAGLGSCAASSTHDRRRLIVAFVGADAEERSALVASIGERRCELADRDVDVYLVDPVEIDALERQDASVDALTERLRRLRDPTVKGLQLVLVGKNGGVKRRARAVAALDELLHQIDGMPMRQAEVRRMHGADRKCS